MGVNGDGSETYYVRGPQYDPSADGPGGELVTYPADQARHSRSGTSHQNQASQKDAGFATSMIPGTANHDSGESDSDDDSSEAGGDDARYSRNYSFTIASPDEEMHGKAVALFDFTSEHQNELPLKEGQIILVSYRHGQGWLVAEDPKTGESGLVPEEFVRLVRDIEGGLNGLGATEIDGDFLTPISASTDSASTPTNHDFLKHSAQSSNGSNTSEKHPPVQSSFSTSSKDLNPYPLPGRTEDVNTPTLPSHPENGKPVR